VQATRLFDADQVGVATGAHKVAGGRPHVWPRSRRRGMLAAKLEEAIMKSLFVAFLVCVGAGAAAGGQARAQDWAVTGSPGPFAEGLDQSSITISGEQRAAWTMSVWRETQEIEGIFFDYGVHREIFDCFQGRRKTVSLHIYHFEQPAPVHSEEIDGEWTSFSPGTIGDALFDAVCSGRRLPSAGQTHTPDFARAIRADLQRGRYD